MEFAATFARPAHDGWRGEKNARDAELLDKRRSSPEDQAGGPRRRPLLRKILKKYGCAPRVIWVSAPRFDGHGAPVEVSFGAPLVARSTCRSFGQALGLPRRRDQLASIQRANGLEHEKSAGLLSVGALTVHRRIDRLARLGWRPNMVVEG